MITVERRRRQLHPDRGSARVVALQLKRPLSVAARSARASSTVLLRSGGPSSETTSSAPPPGAACSEIDPRRRPAPDRLVRRLTENLVQGRLRVLTELVAVLDVELDLDLVPRRVPPRERADRRGEAEPRSTFGSRSSQRARSSRLASRESSRLA